jgi:hypothetical protein
MVASLELTRPPGDLVRLLSAPEGSLDWAVGMRYEIQVSVAQPEADREYIGQCLHGLMRTGAWRLLRNVKNTPFRSFIQLVESPRPHGLGLTREEIEAFLEPALNPNEDERKAAASPSDGPPNGFSSELKLVQRSCLKLTPKERADLLSWLQKLDL